MKNIQKVKIFKLILEGKTNSEIAKKLFISKHTVKAYRILLDKYQHI